MEHGGHRLFVERGGHGYFSIYYINISEQDVPITFFFSPQGTLVTLFFISRSKMLRVHSKPSEEDCLIKTIFLMVFYGFLKITLY